VLVREPRVWMRSSGLMHGSRGTRWSKLSTPLASSLQRGADIVSEEVRRAKGTGGMVRSSFAMKEGLEASARSHGALNPVTSLPPPLRSP